MNVNNASRYPLSWPMGWGRTLAHKRQFSKFRNPKRSWREQDLTVFEGLDRLRIEIRRDHGQHPELSRQEMERREP